MRIRQVRPEFWSDPVVGQMADSVRLFYIGLWNLADDAGWLVWEPAQVAALLYPYRATARREKDISRWLVELIDETRLTYYSCCCVEIPTLPKNQRISGVQSTKVRDLHTQSHPTSKRVPLSNKQSPLNEPDKQSPLSDSDIPFSYVRVGKGRGNGRGYTRPFTSIAGAREGSSPRPVDPTGRTA